LPKFFAFLIAAVLSSAIVTAQKSKPIPVLIIDGFSNHDWKQTSLVTKMILEKSGLFTVDVTTIPTDSIERLAWRADFSKYPVIIQSSNNLADRRLVWPKEMEKKLEEFVSKGGGLYILHSANNAFLHWAEYEKMIGMGWRPITVGYALEIDSNKKIVRIPPGEGKATSHGARFNAVITKYTSHPVNKDYPDQWQTANTEVYNFPRGTAENLTVLSYAYDSTQTHKTWPIEWVVKYGKGNVYNSSMGHLWKGDIYPPAYRCVGFQTTMIRVTEWLATGKVSYKVPTDFPTKDAVSLKPEGDFAK
jgi:type 1 glutamine amidotransferase